MQKKEGNKSKKVYSPEFKTTVIEDMLTNYLGYRETVRKYWKTSNRAEEDLYRSNLKLWERIYQEKGADGFMTAQKGKEIVNKPKKAKSNLGDGLTRENQRLQERIEYLEAENEYLKKLDALVRERIKQDEKKKRK